MHEIRGHRKQKSGKGGFCRARVNRSKQEVRAGEKLEGERETRTRGGGTRESPKGVHYELTMTMAQKSRMEDPFKCLPKVQEESVGRSPKEKKII